MGVEMRSGSSTIPKASKASSKFLIGPRMISSG